MWIEAVTIISVLSASAFEEIGYMVRHRTALFFTGFFTINVPVFLIMIVCNFKTVHKGLTPAFPFPLGLDSLVF